MLTLKKHALHGIAVIHGTQRHHFSIHLGDSDEK